MKKGREREAITEEEERSKNENFRRDGSKRRIKSTKGEVREVVLEAVNREKYKNVKEEKSSC